MSSTSVESRISKVRSELVRLDADAQTTQQQRLIVRRLIAEVEAIEAELLRTTTREQTQQWENRVTRIVETLIELFLGP